MAQQQPAFGVAQVHAVAPAVAEILTRGAFAGAHPRPVAVRKEATLPHVNEIIGVNIALMIIGPYARARRYRAVNKHGTYRHAGLAEEQMVAHVAFIPA